MATNEDAKIKSGTTQDVCKDFRYREWNGSWCQAVLEGELCKRKSRCVVCNAKGRKRQ